jgi:hypothetical protein
VNECLRIIERIVPNRSGFGKQNPTGRKSLSSGNSKTILASIPETSEWEHIGNQFDAAMILARADFVNVLRHQPCGFIEKLNDNVGKD